MLETGLELLPRLIADAAEPLPDIDDRTFGEFFDRFVDARVVMLGEASHGTSEFYRARAAISRRLGIARRAVELLRLRQGLLSFQPDNAVAQRARLFLERMQQAPTEAVAACFGCDPHALYIGRPCTSSTPGYGSTKRAP
jgi:erythromycin esterase-like protein